MPGGANVRVCSVCLRGPTSLSVVGVSDPPIYVTSFSFQGSLVGTQWNLIGKAAYSHLCSHILTLSYGYLFPLGGFQGPVTLLVRHSQVLKSAHETGFRYKQEPHRGIST